MKKKKIATKHHTHQLIMNEWWKWTKPNITNPTRAATWSQRCTSVIPSIKSDELFNVGTSRVRVSHMFLYSCDVPFQVSHTIAIEKHNNNVWIGAVRWIFNKQFKHWIKRLKNSSKCKAGDTHRSRVRERKCGKIKLKQNCCCCCFFFNSRKIIIFARSICLPESIFAIWTVFFHWG